jgi:hypothetical protein
MELVAKGLAEARHARLCPTKNPGKRPSRRNEAGARQEPRRGPRKGRSRMGYARELKG